jgi:quercetin dioxygenase-like cupin family protein
MKLVRQGDALPSAAERRFSGLAELNPRLNEQRLAGMRVAIAKFSNGGRTLWHRHHGEQVLYVLSGAGWVQQDGEDRLQLEPGDIVYVPPGEKHWHGAQESADLEHLAITCGETEWEEEV